MWTHTRLGKWPRVRQRETTVRIHAKADATTTTTTRHTNSRCTNMMTSWHFQTYPSLYQCNSSYRRGGHRGTAPVTDPRWQETFQTSSRPASFPRGSFAPRWLNSPSSNKKQIRHLAVRRWSFLRLSSSTLRVRRSWMAFAKGVGGGRPNQVARRKKRR